jgi:hypothetical protein
MSHQSKMGIGILIALLIVGPIVLFLSRLFSPHIVLIPDLGWLAIFSSGAIALWQTQIAQKAHFSLIGTVVIVVFFSLFVSAASDILKLTYAEYAIGINYFTYLIFTVAFILKPQILKPNFYYAYSHATLFAIGAFCRFVVAPVVMSFIDIETGHLYTTDYVFMLAFGWIYLQVTLSELRNPNPTPEGVIDYTAALFFSQFLMGGKRTYTVNVQPRDLDEGEIVTRTVMLQELADGTFEYVTTYEVRGKPYLEKAILSRESVRLVNIVSIETVD